jgi:hypothetical protein
MGKELADPPIRDVSVVSCHPYNPSYAAVSTFPLLAPSSRICLYDLGIVRSSIDMQYFIRL